MNLNEIIMWGVFFMGVSYGSGDGDMDGKRRDK
jgi:hypothetical protein